MRAILIITILLFSFNVQSQKKELRKIDKLVLESFFEEAKDALESSKSLIISSEDKYRAQYYFYDAKVSNELKMYENAISSLNNLLSINESAYPTKVEQEYKNLSIIISNGIVNGAVNDNKEGNFLASEGVIIDFLEKLGTDRSETIKYINSFSVRQKVKRAIELSKQFKVTATPMIFVDGKYRIEAKGGHSKMLKVVDHVIELQKPVS